MYREVIPFARTKTGRWSNIIKEKSVVVLSKKLKERYERKSLSSLPVNLKPVSISIGNNRLDFVPVVDILSDKEYFVYLIFSASFDEIIYIGQTSEIKNRLRSHISRLNLNIRDIYVSCVRVDSLDKALKLENEYIRFFKPSFNVTGNRDESIY